MPQLRQPASIADDWHWTGKIVGLITGFLLVASPAPATTTTVAASTSATTTTSASSSTTMATTTLMAICLLANLQVLGERKYVVHALAEAEIIGGPINPADEETAALPHQVVADLKGFDACSNLLTGLSVAFLHQVLQHHTLVLQKVRNAN